MTKKVLIFIIVFIVFYEIYVLYSEKPIIVKEKKNNESIESPKIQEINPVENKSFSFINKEIPDDKLEDDEVLVENIDPNMFGKPSEYERDKIIVWSMLDPKPWNKVIYRYKEKYPFNFYLKVRVPSLNDYSNWKNIISNLDFDPRSGEIIIPTEDEETALSIANLIVSNFRGDLSLEEILSKNLIDISINKAKKYEVVKNKLIEQIMTNLNDKPKESFNDTQTYSNDLAKKQNKHDEFTAYEGTEYSFF
jgi:hypothetical protein